jgi:hypothetical protein
MYGWKAMNLAFCSWLRFACPVAPWVMFHEVAFPCARGQRLRHNFLGIVTHVMASLVVRAAERIFFSTLAWQDVLRRLAPVRRPMAWLPVPSNVATVATPEGVQAVRTQCGGASSIRIGHFGTFGGPIVEQLAAVLPPLLSASPDRVGVLVGRGSVGFANELVQKNPAIAGRLYPCGEGSAESVAAALKACDLLVQPYPDGVSTRRGSLMAGLALGVPLVTTAGSATEPMWSAERLVALAPAGDTAALLAAAEALLADPAECQQLGARGGVGYARRFSLENTVRTLRERTAASAMAVRGQE